MRYPTPASLWQALEAGCQRENGCDVLAIPHNTNMGDGKSFDVETESPDHRALRARYERLVEIHQEKGNSECLPAFGGTDEDCNFERFLTRNSRPTPAAEFTQEQWDQMRGSYVRQLLMRGLASYQASGEQKLNPLQLGIIGSTDNHAGTGGFVDEETWPGTVFGLGDLDRAMIRQAWNPGGLVAVWAEENTRPAVFAALSRREVYATSGPRIRLQMQASTDALDCDHTPTTKLTPMGGTVATTTATRAKLSLRVRAQADQSPLTQVEIIKGTLADGELREEVVTIWQQTEGASDLCHTWQDPNFEPDTPAFWYARVKQTSTPRWTAWRCQRAGRCDEFEGADTWIQERAWSSPIWYLP